MFPKLKYLGRKLLGFIVDTLQKVTILATLFAIATCMVLFFVSFFAGYPVYAFLSLCGMICFIYANKQY